jgi:hypothetical protein
LLAINSHIYIVESYLLTLLEKAVFCKSRSYPGVFGD